MSTDNELRNHVINLLEGGHAYVRLDSALENFPFDKTGVKPEAFDHSAWQLLEHIRIAQWDIVEFTVNANHVSPKWPEDYWPKEDAPASEKDWLMSVEAVKKDLQKMQGLVHNTATDLFAKIPHGTGQTVLREALLVADHNAYHLGQLVMLRKVLGIWPPE